MILNDVHQLHKINIAISSDLYMLPLTISCVGNEEALVNAPIAIRAVSVWGLSLLIRYGKKVNPLPTGEGLNRDLQDRLLGR